MQSAGRGARGAVLLLLAALVAFAGWKAFWGALHGPGCRPENPAQGDATAAAAAVAFVLGHVFARYRQRREIGLVARRPTLSAKVVQGALALLALVVVGVFAYETLGVLGVDGLRPITSYVRCARADDPFWTAAAAAVTCFLAGHWLWFPAARGEDA